MTAPVVVIQNHADVPPAWVEDAIAAAGGTTELVRFTHGDPLPDPSGCRAVVALGGFQSAIDLGNDPMLAAEIEFLRSLVENGVPTLGICLGCQLLSAAFGGVVSRLPEPEIAYGPLAIEAHAEPHPVAAALDRAPVLSIHQDTWTVPSDGTLIAATDLSPQVFSIGSAVGFQPHPEIPADLAAVWIESLSGAPDPDLVQRIAADESARRSLMIDLVAATLFDHG